MVWSKRRRASVPPVLLPSLDRLATLIDRVVELVDAVGGSQAPDAEPEPAPEPPREPLPAAGTQEAAWLAFVPSAHGYRLVERPGAAPSSGQVLELDDGLYRVVRLSPSPLPRDGRLCAYVEREEPPAEDRTFDA